MAATEHKLGPFLARVRKKQKRKLKDVALAIGRSPSYVCDIEKGRRGQQIDHIVMIKWADYLNLPITTIFTQAGLIDKEYELKYGAYFKILRSRMRAQRVGKCLTAMRDDIEAIKSPTKPRILSDSELAKNLENHIVELETLLTYGCVFLAKLVVWWPYVA